MIQTELTDRKQQLISQVDRLLSGDFKKLTPGEHKKITGILSEIEGLNIKIYGQDPVVRKPKKVYRPARSFTRRRINNTQLRFTF
jgi:hypothetical protein